MARKGFQDELVLEFTIPNMIKHSSETMGAYVACSERAVHEEQLSSHRHIRTLALSHKKCLYYLFWVPWN